MNNVSLGVYARIVQSDAYRDDKLGTTAEMIPQLLGPGSEGFDLEYVGPGGNTHERADLMLISNNPYRLDRIGGFGSRVRMDTGKLGVVVVEVRTAADVAELMAAQTAGTVSRYRGWREWEADTFEVRSGESIEAGVDGEALHFDSPLRFEILPGAARAGHHITRVTHLRHWLDQPVGAASVGSSGWREGVTRAACVCPRLGSMTTDAEPERRRGARAAPSSPDPTRAAGDHFTGFCAGRRLGLGV